MSSHLSFHLQELDKIPLNPPLKKGEMGDLEQSILSTIVYYDCLDYPLTATEIYWYLTKSGTKGVIASTFTSFSINSAKQSQVIDKKHEIASSSFDSVNTSLRTPRNDNMKPPLFEILKTLDESEVLKKFINQKNGFYFLRERETIVEERIQRKKLADEKWKKIKPILRLCLIVPYIRAIFMSGSLALGNVKKESDIDIMIVVKHGRIWTSRAFLTVLLSLLGKYRQTKSTADKICPNHYITHESLNIPFHSLYNAQTYAHLFAVDPNSNKYLEKFKKANSWIGNYLYCFDSNENRNSHTLKLSLQIYFFLFIRRIFELFLDNKFGDWLENKFRTFETNRIKKSELYQKSGGRITLSDEQLEFHPDSPEKIIVEKFNRKMRQLGFSQLANLKDSGLK